MSLVKVTPPPGVVKPGTIYDAAGRWYHTHLARWHEGVMQPIGGWQQLVLSPSGPVAAALTDTEGSISDFTDRANDEDDTEVVLGVFVAGPDVDDAFYVAGEAPIEAITIDIAATGVGGSPHVVGDWVVEYEYWDGSAWSSLSDVTDDTDEFTIIGQNSISWTVPGDWAVTTVDVDSPSPATIGPFYLVRFRLSAVTTPGFVNANRVYIGIPLLLNEPVRGTHSWRTNAGAPRLALGTPTSIYVYSAGALDDITPSSGFTPGEGDAEFSAGNFGAGLFGAGPFGIGDDELDTLTEANTWQIDNYGEDLVLVALADGDLWYWDQDGAGNMAPITPSAGTVPTSNLGVVVTPEHFIVVLGAGGDRRRLMWPDQSDHTDWDITSTVNSAGDLPLPGKGAILAARRAQSETLIWTESDVFALRYIGGDFIYTPVPVGSDGAISRRSMMVIGKGAIWMGQRGFFSYDGYTQPLPSTMSDYVFNDMNRVQASKIWAEHRAEFGEVIWHYPSGSVEECDRAVVYNYRAGIWYPLDIARTGGEDRGALPYPIAVDADGFVWQHETGRDYPDQTELPYAESGPMELGNGDRVMHLKELIPDERTLGQLDVRLYLAEYPKGTETEIEVDINAERMDLRETARQARIRVETSPDQGEADWRLGTIRLDLEPGGLR